MRAAEQAPTAKSLAELSFSHVTSQSENRSLNTSPTATKDAMDGGACAREVLHNATAPTIRLRVLPGATAGKAVYTFGAKEQRMYSTAASWRCLRRPQGIQDYVDGRVTQRQTLA